MTKEQQDTIKKLGEEYAWSSSSRNSLLELVLSRELAILKSRSPGYYNPTIKIVDKLLMDVDGSISRSTFLQYIDSVSISEAKALIKKKLKLRNFL